MKNLNQFSSKAQYITPSCKTVLLQARDVILQGSVELQYSSRMGGAGEDLEDNVYNDAF